MELTSGKLTSTSSTLRLATDAADGTTSSDTSAFEMIFCRFFDTFIAHSMRRKVTNGGNCRWATCYNDSVALRVYSSREKIAKIDGIVDQVD